MPRFLKYSKKPTSIKYGSLYIATFDLSFCKDKKRKIRIYLPENYSKKEKYPLIIFADGQNIVDKYTASFSSWELDKRMHQLLKKEKHSFILVGIDSPKNGKDRILEYGFSNVPFKKMYDKDDDLELGSHLKAYGDDLISNVVHTIIPSIESSFSCSGERIVVGASMGAIFAINSILLYPSFFSGAFCFSPAFNLYDKRNLISYLKSFSLDNKKHFLSFYSGALDYEKQFLKPLVDVFMFFEESGFLKDNLSLIIDSGGIHNEVCWSKYINKMLNLYIKFKEKR